MALPELIQKNSLQNSKELNNVLGEQVRFLRIISESITKNNQEFGSLRKDMSDLKKEFVLGMNSFSEVKKYLEDIRAEQLSSKPIKPKDEEKSFFSKAIDKLLGKKSSYDDAELTDLQRKILEETTVVKNLSLNIDENISIIRKSYEPTEKAKDRKLLAEAIADAMDGGSGNRKGFMGMIAALGLSLAALGTYLVKGISSAVGEIFSRILQTLGLSKAIPTVLPQTGGPDVDKDGKKKPTQKPTQKPQSTWWEKTKEGARTAGKGILRGVAGGAAIGALVTPSELGDATMEEYLRKKQEEANTKPGGIRGNLQEQMDAEYKRKQELYQSEKFRNDRDAITREFMSSNIDDRKKQDILSVRDDQERYSQMVSAMLEKQKEVSENQINTQNENIDLYSLMTEKLKGIMDDIGGITSGGISEKLESFLNTLGEIDLGEGQKINLAPNLGTSLASAIDSMGNELSMLKEAGNGNFNAVVQNSTNMSGGTTTIFPDASAISPDMNDYRSRRPIQ